MLVNSLLQTYMEMIFKTICQIKTLYEPPWSFPEAADTWYCKLTWNLFLPYDDPKCGVLAVKNTILIVQNVSFLQMAPHLTETLKSIDIYKFLLV